MQARPLDRQALNPRIAIQQGAEQRLDPAIGQREMPRPFFLGRIAGQRRPPRAIARPRAQPHLRPQLRARIVHRTLEPDAPARDDRHPLAQAFGMGDDMGGKQHGDAPLRLLADQPLQLLLVDRIQPGKGLVQHDQPRLVDDGAEQLHRLRHPLGQLPDRLVDRRAHAMALQHFARPHPPLPQWQSAQRAHEGNRLIGLHRGIQTALFG